MKNCLMLAVRPIKSIINFLIIEFTSYSLSEAQHEINVEGSDHEHGCILGFAGLTGRSV